VTSFSVRTKNGFTAIDTISKKVRLLIQQGVVPFHCYDYYYHDYYSMVSMGKKGIHFKWEAENDYYVTFFFCTMMRFGNWIYLYEKAEKKAI
jgi:hypothetical protein